MRGTLIALACAGCLSTPKPADGDGGTIDAAPDPCVRDVRPAAACNTPDQFISADLPDPVPGFRQLVTDDVNADGRLDLIVVGSTVHVLLGPVALDFPIVHGSVDTGLEVAEVEARAVVGPSGCADLTIFGSGPGGGTIQIWPYVGQEGVMFATENLTRGVDFDPVVANVPAMLEWVRLHEGTDDLLVADLNRLRVIHVDGDPENLDTKPLGTVTHDGAPNWDSINGIAAAPVGTCAVDRVLVAENREAYFLDETATDGAYDGRGPVAMPALTLGIERGDLDGVRPDDVIVGGGQEIGAYLLAEDGDDAITATAVSANHEIPLLPGDFLVDGFAVGDVGGSPALDWVAIDAPDDGTTASNVWYIESLAVDGGQLLLQGADDLALPEGFVPRDVVIGELVDGNDRVDILVASREGQLYCLQRAANTAQLEPCLP